MNIKIALGSLAVCSALAFWACADGEVITADASEEVALQQVLHNRVTVDDAVNACAADSLGCKLAMENPSEAKAPDAGNNGEGAPENSDSASSTTDGGSTLPGTGGSTGGSTAGGTTPSGGTTGGDTPTVTSSASQGGTTPAVTSSASQGGTTPASSAAVTPKSSASTGGSSTSTGGSSSSGGGSAVPTNCDEVSMEYQGAEETFKANKCYKVACSKGMLVCKTTDGSTKQIKIDGKDASANEDFWSASGGCGVVETTVDIICKNDY